MVEMVISQTTHTKELKIEDTHITLHHSDNKIQCVTNKAFTTEGHPGQLTDLTVPLHLSTPIVSSIPPTQLLVTQNHHHIPGAQFMRIIYYHLS